MRIVKVLPGAARTTEQPTSEAAIANAKALIDLIQRVRDYMNEARVHAALFAYPNVVVSRRGHCRR